MSISTAGAQAGPRPADMHGVKTPRKAALASWIDLATRMRDNGVRPEIEIFDLSHLHAARRLADQGLMDERPHVQFVMGVKNAMPAQEHLLDILLGEFQRLFPQATWTAAGIGRHQAEVPDWALARGADAVRTGLEDNIRLSKDRLARSNAQLVSLAVEAIARHGRRPATPAQARDLLGLGSSAS
jgi:3-keto-5-aminohexanoate cleavage enzyme